MLNVVKKFVFFLVFVSCVAVADRPVIVSYGKADDSFSIRGVELGATEAELIAKLDEPISKVEQPPQFGEIEIEYRYQGLAVHLTDGIVASLNLKQGPYKLDNGLLIGMTRVRVENFLGKSFELDHIGLQFGESDCYAFLFFSERVLVEVKQHCAG